MDNDIGPCLEWQGYRTAKGYGRVRQGAGHITVHRLVWIGAHGPVPEIDGKPGMILHRCDNPPCFRLDHLYAASHADNMRDRALAGHYGQALGEHNGNSKLTAADVREIRRLAEEEGLIQRRIGELYGIHQVQVSAIVRRKAWAHVP
jgi:predicted XRE-type DNA-binding protein